jgi:hypothetical protein
MTNSNSKDRLDRIEAILENVAIGQERFVLQQQDYERRQEEQQENFNRDLLELKNIVVSNSRTIQSILDNRESERLEHESRMQRLEDNLIELTGISRALTNIYVGLDENQPTILRRLMSIENKVDRILDRNQD